MALYAQYDSQGNLIPGVATSNDNIKVKRGSSNKTSSSFVNPFSFFGNQMGFQKPLEDQAKTQGDAITQKYNDLLKQSYDYSAGKLKDATDANLRELYIKNQQAQSLLPEQLARAGISGGATETTLANLNAGYQNGRNQARSDYLSQLADLGQNYQESLANKAIQQDETYYQYLLDLAKMEKQWQLENRKNGFMNPYSAYM